LPKDFYRLSPIEFDYALQDWTNEDRAKWERMRLQIFYLINPHLKKPILRPDKLINFEWDIKPEDIEFTDEYYERIKARDKKVFEQLKNGKNTKGVNDKA